MLSDGLPLNIHQGLLEKSVRLIFPNAKIYVESKKQSNIKYPTTGQYLELDVYIPELNISFEFQDAYHYTTTWYAHRTLDVITRNDNIKKNMLYSKGITLISVPCWWDGTIVSLEASISFQRPDLLLIPAANLPSLNPSLKFFCWNELPGVGELMLASFPMGNDFGITLEHHSWWIGEKYDGIRCFWNPKRSTVYSRKANAIPLYASITTSLPKSVMMDGEFWFGRGLFGNTIVLILGNNLEAVAWHMLRLVAFDVPWHKSQNKVFEERYQTLFQHVNYDHPFTVVVARLLCDNSAQLYTLLTGIIAEGGEGVIVRRTGSIYEAGRSRNLIKFKTALFDKEGLVVDISPNEVVLKLPNSQIFSVPLTQVHIPIPKKGEIVTFSYEIHSRREPLNPEIYRARPDLTWDDLLQDEFKDHKYLLNDLSQFTAQFSHVYTHAQDTMRNFMKNVAKKYHMDPLDPDTWYLIPYESIYQSKTGKRILQKFKTHHNVLRELFPELNLDDRILLSSWSELKQRQKFFENYALLNNQFDPLIPNNWYKQPANKIMSTKGIKTVLSYHNGSLSQALMDCFPGLTIDPTKLLCMASYWGEVKNRRGFFEKYAQLHHFDPLVPTNWHSHSRENIMATKGAVQVMTYYMSITSALNTLFFPNIHNMKETLRCSKAWHKNEQRRMFFEKYAKRHGFDPLVAENWEAQSPKQILNTQGTKKVLYSKGSMSGALQTVFPDVSFRFNVWHPGYHHPEARRRFFEEFAALNKFNPLVPENWYSIPHHMIMSVQGAAQVMKYYSDNIDRALLELFPNIGFQSHRFLKIYARENGRKLFKNYAKICGFDPLIPEHWYIQPKSKLLATEGTKWVISYYYGSVFRTLQCLFPEIHFDRYKFKFSPSATHQEKATSIHFNGPLALSPQYSPLAVSPHSNPPHVSPLSDPLSFPSHSNLSISLAPPYSNPPPPPYASLLNPYTPQQNTHTFSTQHPSHVPPPPAHLPSPPPTLSSAPSPLSLSLSPPPLPANASFQQLANLISNTFEFQNLTPLEKAVKLVTEYKVTGRKAAHVCEIHKNSLARGLASAKKGRDIGVPGRSKIFGKKQEEEFVGEVLQGVKLRKLMTFSQAQEKCMEIYAQTKTASHKSPTFTREFMKRILDDHNISIKCIQGPWHTSKSTG
eukprot:Phypoly_transcript_01229.p1 GENE.Phypoly_transcript_01229~~Phypoly_transcript_01229.p1  ORF type:complete len:1158 (+),score=134.52 Phypoly_transcript_01229:34-3507(+)